MTDARTARADDIDDDMLLRLSAFVDDELPDDSDLASMQARIKDDTTLAARVADYKAQQSALRTLFPDEMDAQRCYVVRAAQMPFSRKAAWAAGFLFVGIAFGMLGSQFLQGNTAAPAFAHDADSAYAVYVPERRHAVEVGAAEHEHLVAWLSKRLNHSIRIPSLREYGYGLVGGRLLPGATGPAALFMYENDQGGRLTFYMTSAGQAEQARTLQSLQGTRRNTIFWAHRNMGYALSGDASEAELQAMAQVLFQAEGTNGKAWQ